MLILLLCIIFNTCLIFDYCFSIFRDSITIILKKLKDDDFNEFRNYSNFKSYWFITLFETLKKTIKIILTKKLIYLTKTFNLFFRNHMKKHRCTFIEYAIHLLIKCVIIIRNKNLIMTTLFLNVIKVFDNVLHERLFHILKKQHILILLIKYLFFSKDRSRNR